MDEAKKYEPEASTADGNKLIAAPRKGRGFLLWCAALGILLTIVAWGVYFFNGNIAAIIGIVALVAASTGTASGHGCLRDLSITAIVASAVLLIVYVIFRWGIPYLLH